METPLRIFIAYGSWHVGARVIHRLTSEPNVELVGQAREANNTLALIALKKPDLVVLDVSLADGSGISVLRSLKSVSTAIIVIMTSTSTYPQYRKECLKAGADFFYYLPDEIEEMSRKVSAFAASKSIDDAGVDGFSPES